MTKISDLTALAGSAVDDANDLLPVVDMSEAGTARNKKITFDETRIALGLSTADSPQFTALNLGHASDTTITRVSAGVAAIEGVNIVTTAGGITFAADISVPDEAYDATNWDGNLEVPTKNAVRDKIESMSVGSGIAVEDEGVSEGTGLTTLNFTGSGVSVTVTGAEAEVIIPGGGGGIDVEDEGVAEATGATILNFTGVGVTATDVGGGQVDVDIPGGGTASGTSFPGSPATDDLFYRTDRRIEYFYDGTRWLSTHLHTMTLPSPNGAIAVDLTLYTAIPWLGVYSLYLERIDVSTMYDAASANWHVVLFYVNSANSNTIIADVDGSTPNTANTWYNRGASIGSVLNAAAVAFNVTYDEQAGAASFRGGALLSYRLVG